MRKEEFLDFAIDWLEMLKSDYIKDGRHDEANVVQYVIDNNIGFESPPTKKK